MCSNLNWVPCLCIIITVNIQIYKYVQNNIAAVLVSSKLSPKI